VLVSSALYGLWHALPAPGPVDANAPLTSVTGSTGGTIAVVAGTVATTAAGAALCWLRLRSGSLAAPVVAHCATNTVPLTTTWVLTR
jgi:membrane protease YdiL (CAAX protease family)